VRWLTLTQKNGHATAKRRLLGVDDRARELIMMGLRLVEGIDKTRFESIIGLPIEPFFDQAARQRLIDGGLLIDDGSRVFASTDGRQRLNGVLGALLS